MGANLTNLGVSSAVTPISQYFLVQGWGFLHNHDIMNCVHSNGGVVFFKETDGEYHMRAGQPQGSRAVLILPNRVAENSVTCCLSTKTCRESILIETTCGSCACCIHKKLR